MSELGDYITMLRNWTNHNVVNPITGRNPITQETLEFSPKVHVLVGTLVPVVSINTSLGGGHEKSPTHAEARPLLQAI